MIRSSLITEQDKILSNAFRTHQKDGFFLEKKGYKKHFNKKFEPKTVLLHKSSF